MEQVMEDLKELKVKAYDKIAEIEQSMYVTEQLKKELQQINEQIAKLLQEKK